MMYRIWPAPARTEAEGNAIPSPRWWAGRGRGNSLPSVWGGWFVVGLVALLLFSPNCACADADLHQLMLDYATANGVANSVGAGVTDMSTYNAQLGNPCTPDELASAFNIGGSAVQTYITSEYNAGHESGYGDGHQAGYDEGYQAGVTASGGDTGGGNGGNCVTSETGLALAMYSQEANIIGKNQLSWQGGIVVLLLFVVVLLAAIMVRR